MPILSILNRHLLQMKQASEERKIASRLSQAVPVIFSGACDEEANGAYDPIYELHDQWPIYRKRDGKTEIILLYVASKSSWIIKTVYVGQSYDEVSLFDSPGNNADRRGKCLVTLFTGCPSFPELRLEGSNGISEACAPRRNGHEMSIVPESELIGALEMEKLKQRNNSLSSESLRDAWQVSSLSLSVHITFAICLSSVGLVKDYKLLCFEGHCAGLNFNASLFFFIRFFIFKKQIFCQKLSIKSFRPYLWWAKEAAKG